MGVGRQKKPYPAGCVKQIPEFRLSKSLSHKLWSLKCPYTTVCVWFRKILKAAWYFPWEQESFKNREFMKLETLWADLTLGPESADAEHGGKQLKQERGTSDGLNFFKNIVKTNHLILIIFLKSFEEKNGIDLLHAAGCRDYRNLELLFASRK